MNIPTNSGSGLGTPPPGGVPSRPITVPGGTATLIAGPSGPPGVPGEKGDPGIPSVIPASIADPTAAANQALVIGLLHGTVVLAPLGTTGDIARLEAVKTAVGGRYPIVCQAGTWKDAGGAVITMPSNPWLYQAAWYIDPVAGNDLTGDGSNAHPIKSWNELRRRMAKGTSAITVAVYLYSTLTEDVIIDWQSAGELSGVGRVLIYGVKTYATAEDTVAANVAYDPATRTFGYFTGTAITDFTAHAGRLFEITSGARLGAIGHIVGPVSGHVDRCSFAPMLLANQVTTEPVAGDKFKVYTVSKIIGHVELRSSLVLYLIDINHN